MARIFVTGSADGLGRMAAGLLVADGHDVVLHARNEARGRDALRGRRGAAGVVTGDLATLAGMRTVAESGERARPVRRGDPQRGRRLSRAARVATADGLPHVLAINSLAPYVLTALMVRPARLVYASSGLHRSGDASLARPRVDRAAVERHAGVFRFEAARRAARVRDRAPLAGGALERAGAGLGRDEDGRRRARRTTCRSARGRRPGSPPATIRRRT